MTETADLLALARAAKGFMPDDEGLALHRLARERLPHGPVLEIGTYCGKSAIYLGAAAREVGGVVFTVDHHRGSEENQAGWEHHDPTLVDRGHRTHGHPAGLPPDHRARPASRTSWSPSSARSATVAAHWRTPLSLLFIDGGHGDEPAQTDYHGWAPLGDARRRCSPSTTSSRDPADGGRPPYDVYLRALDSGAFAEADVVGLAAGAAADLRRGRRGRRLTRSRTPGRAARGRAPARRRA